MAINPFRWVRKFIRSNTRPILPERASLWKVRMSHAYMVISWHVLGLLGYLIIRDKASKELTPEEFASSAEFECYAVGKKQVHILKYKGFTKVADYEYKRKETNVET